jgi:hypothetical protein
MSAAQTAIFRMKAPLLGGTRNLEPGTLCPHPQRAHYAVRGFAGGFKQQRVRGKAISFDDAAQRIAESVGERLNSIIQATLVDPAIRVLVGQSPFYVGEPRLAIAPAGLYTIGLK